MGRVVVVALVAGLVGGIGLGMVGWIRHRLRTARLVRRLLAHLPTPAPTPEPWWERASARLAPVASVLEGFGARLTLRLSPLDQLGSLVAQARVGSSPAEVVAVGVVVGPAAFVGAVASGVAPPVAAALAVVAGAAPVGVVAVLAARRRRAFAAELPDVLALLAGSLRAGLPLVAALDAVATDAGGPVAPELRRVAGETALGRALPDALASVGERMRSEEVAWVGLAVDIHQQVGGNLAEVLDTVARTISERQQLQREVAALTAEGRISAIVLGILPVALAAVIAVVNPGYLVALVEQRLGTVLLVTSVVGMVVGFVWMRRIVVVDV